MTFLAPGALFFGLLAVPIIILYLLKLRRQETPVSSTLLWQMVLREQQANAPWKRLERNLLLFLQLLILAAVVLALARPALAVPGLAADGVVLLLDGSASMNATDIAGGATDIAGGATDIAGGATDIAGGATGSDGATRFAAAQQAALALIDELPASARVTLILAGPQPASLASAETDRSLLRRRVQEAAPSQGVADWQAALTLAAGALRPYANPSLVILSDGGIPEQGLSPMPGQVLYLPVGRSGENLALSAFALRPSPDGAETVELFASVTNYGEVERPAVLSFYAGEELFAAQQLTLPAGESLPVVLSAAPLAADGRYTARLSPAPGQGETLDPLPLDDQAFAVYRPPAETRVLLVTPGNLFLSQLLAALPGVEAYSAPVAESGQIQLPESSEQPYGVYVFDGVLPETLPEGNLLILNPPPGETLFPVGGVITATAQAQVQPHPLTEFLDWSQVHILRARQVELPSWGEALVTAGGAPLVFAGETGGRRVAVLAFDLHDSDLPLQVAFPILFANLFDYLGQQPDELLSDDPGQLRPGDSLFIRPRSGAEAVRVLSQDGETRELSLGEAGAPFSATEALGFYQVTALGEAPPEPAYFPVNLFSPLESGIAPAETLRLGASQVPAGVQGEAGRRELWPWLAAAALALLLIEWLVYYRRQKPV